VAVVQISRIQHRRGQKNTGSGLPQLASGELGWAIDTRELYIGNGAVSEGAPAVGNTKIITEYDNILDFANTYTYRVNDDYIQTGEDSATFVTRSLQARLDDFVSVRSFGAVGDGVTDDTAAIQRAIDQLFLNPANKNSPASRYKLRFDPGTYIVNSTIFVPPFANLIGSGKQKTVIQSSSADAILKTVNGLSDIGTPADDSQTTLDNLAQYVVVEGMSLITSSGSSRGIVLQNCKNSSFRDLEIKGTWEVADGDMTDSVAIQMNSLGAEVSSDNNIFEDCTVKYFSYAVRSNWDIKFNKFTQCDFSNLHIGFSFGDDIILGSSGKTSGPRRNTIANCLFSKINRQAILIEQGRHNLSQSNSFRDVGNDQGSEKDAVSSVLRFDVLTNQSKQDYFTRTGELIAGGGLAGKPYLAEISGPGFYSIAEDNSITFGSFQNQRLFRLPGVTNQSYEVDYTILSPNYFRSGILSIIVDGYNNNIELADDFQHIGDDLYMCDISFSGSLKNLSGSGNRDTIEIKVTSSVPDTDERTLTYNIQSKNTDTT
jgi:hypothetical protein